MKRVILMLLFVVIFVFCGFTAVHAAGKVLHI
jgi:hypothetical protein